MVSPLLQFLCENGWLFSSFLGAWNPNYPEDVLMQALGLKLWNLGSFSIWTCTHLTAMSKHHRDIVTPNFYRCACSWEGAILIAITLNRHDQLETLSLAKVKYIFSGTAPVSKLLCQFLWFCNHILLFKKKNFSCDCGKTAQIGETVSTGKPWNWLYPRAIKCAK